jgi:hypothetical protein
MNVLLRILPFLFLVPTSEAANVADFARCGGLAEFLTVTKEICLKHNECDAAAAKDVIKQMKKIYDRAMKDAEKNAISSDDFIKGSGEVAKAFHERVKTDTTDAVFKEIQTEVLACAKQYSH